MVTLSAETNNNNRRTGFIHKFFQHPQQRANYRVTGFPLSKKSKNKGTTKRTTIQFLLFCCLGPCFFGCLILLELWWIRKSSANTASTIDENNNDNNDNNESVDGWFNGAPLTLRTRVPNPQSMVHCVGDNYFRVGNHHEEENDSVNVRRDNSNDDDDPDDDGWKDRSCHFTSLFCFNTSNQRYVVFESPAEQLLRRIVNRASHPSLLHISSLMMTASSTTNKNSNNTTTDSSPSSSSSWKNNKPKSVALGGINTKWGKAGIQRLKWFPDIIQNVTELSYYELPPSAVLIPFHSLNGANPGHLVWDDFLSIFNLLDMFDLLPTISRRKKRERNHHRANNNNHQKNDDPSVSTSTNKLLLMRYVLPKNDDDDNRRSDASRGLWASCDWTAEKTRQCQAMMNKFVPLMLGRTDDSTLSLSTTSSSSYQWSTTQSFDFQPLLRRSSSNHDQTNNVDLVCASHGVAGLGSLTDHGYRKTHGWVPEDYDFSHNHGRGGLIRAFRNFAVQNVLPPSNSNSKSSFSSSLLRRRSAADAEANDGDVDDDDSMTAFHASPPFRVVFSVNSSDIPARIIDFTNHMELVKQYVPMAQVESYSFQHLSLEEQIQIAQETAIFVTACGGGAVTSMFLSAGTSAILFYHEHGGVRPGHFGSVPTNTPAFLDWDLFTAMTHLRVHWMPRVAMDQMSHQMAFVALIRRELDLLPKTTTTGTTPA